MPNNFWCTDWRPDCCISYPLHIQEKSKRTAPNAEQFFTDSKTELGAGFLVTPSAIRGLKNIDLYNIGTPAVTQRCHRDYTRR